MNGAEKGSKSWRQFLPLLFLVYTFLIVVQVALVILSYIDLSIFFGGVLITILTVPLVYAIWHIQTKYQHTQTLHVVNKIAFIGAGALLGFSLTMFLVIFILLVTDMTSPFSTFGPVLTIILLVVIPTTIGGLVGYTIGKRRNYMPYR
jgi:glycerol uptake facilitator-like aquaporin